MKNFYIVLGIDTKGTEEEPNKRYYVDVMKVSPQDNIYCRLDHVGGLLHANICESKKKAEEIRDQLSDYNIDLPQLKDLTLFKQTQYRKCYIKGVTI